MKTPAAKAILAALLLIPVFACVSSKDPKPKVAPDEVATNAAKGDSGGGGFLGFGKRKPNAGPCPLLGVLYDAARMVELNGEEKYENVGFTGEVQDVGGLCRYTGADPIVVNMDIEFAFGRGPAAGADRRTYRYWVAVTERDHVALAKQYFDIDVVFPNGVDRVTTTEKIKRIVIPRANKTISGENFEILVGFELTPQELAFNRDGKHFRLDAAAKPGG